MSSESEISLAGAFESLLSPSQAIEYAVIDVFANGPFGGNPAAVVPLKGWKDDSWLQNVAAEFNLPITSYVKKREEQGKEDIRSTEATEERPVIHEYDLRWFTVKKEVDICGHGTMASAHLLYQGGIVGKKDTIFFHTRGGLFSTRYVEQADEKKTSKNQLVELNFPWITTTPSTTAEIKPLRGMLGDVEIVAVGKASSFLIVELASRDDLDKLTPDVQELLDCSSDGLIVTTLGTESSGFDFASRVFAPKYGVSEDPATGMAHSILGPYWSTKLNKSEMLAYQASKRGGTLEIQLDKKLGRVNLRGRGSVIMSGVLHH